MKRNVRLLRNLLPIISLSVCTMVSSVSVLAYGLENEEYVYDYVDRISYNEEAKEALRAYRDYFESHEASEYMDGSDTVPAEFAFDKPELHRLSLADIDRDGVEEVLINGVAASASERLSIIDYRNGKAECMFCDWGFIPGWYTDPDTLDEGFTLITGNAAQFFSFRKYLLVDKDWNEIVYGDEQYVDSEIGEELDNCYDRYGNKIPYNYKVFSDIYSKFTENSESFKPVVLIKNEAVAEQDVSNRIYSEIDHILTWIERDYTGDTSRLMSQDDWYDLEGEPVLTQEQASQAVANYLEALQGNSGYVHYTTDEEPIKYNSYVGRLRYYTGAFETCIVNLITGEAYLYGGYLNAGQPEPVHQVAPAFSVYDYLDINTGSSSNIDYSDTEDYDIDSDQTFIDVSEEDYYYEGVLWVTEEGLMDATGSNTFSPQKECTRKEVLMTLWRLYGCPMVDDLYLPYKDADPDSDYYEALKWAVQSDILNVITKDQFQPDKICTRRLFISILWNLNGCKVPQIPVPFSDIKDGSPYADAIRWAYNEGITLGTDSGEFRPMNGCTRAHLAVFLYRCYAANS